MFTFINAAVIFVFGLTIAFVIGVNMLQAQEFAERHKTVLDYRMLQELELAEREKKVAVNRD